MQNNKKQQGMPKDQEDVPAQLWWLASILIPQTTSTKTSYPFLRLLMELQSTVITYATPVKPIYQYCIPGVMLGTDYEQDPSYWRSCWELDYDDCLCYRRCCGKCKDSSKTPICYCWLKDSCSPYCTCRPLRNGLLSTCQKVRKEELRVMFGKIVFLAQGNTY